MSPSEISSELGGEASSAGWNDGETGSPSSKGQSWRLVMVVGGEVVELFEFTSVGNVEK